MQVICILLRQITMPTHHHSSFSPAECSSCSPTNSVKAQKAKRMKNYAMFSCLASRLVWKWNNSTVFLQPWGLHGAHIMSHPITHILVQMFCWPIQGYLQQLVILTGSKGLMQWNFTVQIFFVVTNQVLKHQRPLLHHIIQNKHMGLPYNKNGTQRQSPVQWSGTLCMQPHELHHRL